MATSGRMEGDHFTIGGQGGNYFFIDWDLSSQSTAGNTSTISWDAYFHFNGADNELNNGDVFIDGDQDWNATGTVHSFGSNFTVRNVHLASGSDVVPHNADGTEDLTISGGVDIFGEGRSNGSQTWSLPTIDRFANITNFSQSNVDYFSFQVNVSANVTCDILDYKLDGGAWTRAFTGNFTSKSFTIDGLNSGQQYSIEVRVRRNDSGLYTDSNTENVTTTAQSQMIARAL